MVALRGLEGITLWDGRGCWLLARPQLHPEVSEDLMRLLKAERLPPRSDLATALRVPSPTRFDTPTLVGWRKAHATLARRRDLEALIEEGVAPLRSYRGQDLKPRIERAGQRLDELEEHLASHELWRTVLADSAPATLSRDSVARLRRARLEILATWEPDPLGLVLGAGKKRDPWAAARAMGAPHHVADTLRRRRVPYEEGLRLARIHERLAVLFGAGRATTWLRNAWQRWPLARELSPALAASIRRFLLIVDDPERPCRHAAERAVARACSRDPKRPAARKEFVRAYAALLDSSGERRPVGLRRLVKAAFGSHASAWSQLAPVLVDFTQQALVTSGLHGVPAAQLRAARDRLGLLQPEGTQPAAFHREVEALTRLTDLLASLPPERRAVVWPLVREPVDGELAPHGLGRLLRSSLPLGQVQRALEVGGGFARQIGEQVKAFEQHPRRLDALLASIEAVPPKERGVLGTDKGWYVNLFTQLTDAPRAAALALAAQFGRAKLDSAAPARFRILCEAFRGDAKELGGALEHWDRFPASTWPEGCDQLVALGIASVEALQRYLHYGTLLGRPPALSAALLEPLRLAEKAQGELAWIRSQLAAAELPPSKRTIFEQRAARLANPLHASTIWAASIRRAHKRFGRALEQRRIASLQVVIRRALRDLLGRFLGDEGLPEILPEGLGEAMVLFGDAQADKGLLLNFIRQAAHGRPFADLPANAAWLGRAAKAGIDTTAWLAGFDETIQLDGQTVRLATEACPVQRLMLGCPFDTCLDLYTGFNRWSALVNATDVNKQVIYGRSPEGVVVLRKLVGATLDGRLAGYRTYTTGAAPRGCKETLDALLLGHADRCGLALSNTATPEVLHGSGDWYDDGNEHWSVQKQLPPSPPGEPTLPSDREAMADRLFRAALTTADPDMVGRLNGRRQVGAYFQLLSSRRMSIQTAARTERPRFCDESDLYDAHWRLCCAGHREAFRHAKRFITNEELGDRLWRRLLDLAPADEAVLGDLVLGIEGLAAQGPSDPEGPGWAVASGSLSPHLALLPQRKLLALFRALAPLIFHWTKGHAPFVRDARSSLASLLQAAFLREKDGRPLVRALRRGAPFVRGIALVVTQRERVKGSVSALVALASRQGGPIPRSEVLPALVRQGGPRVRDLLWRLLRREPSSLELAVALTRAGGEPWRRRAAELWQPPRDLERALARRDFVDTASELHSPALSRRVRNLILRRRSRHHRDAASMDEHSLESPEGHPLTKSFPRLATKEDLASARAALEGGHGGGAHWYRTVYPEILAKAWRNARAQRASAERHWAYVRDEAAGRLSPLGPDDDPHPHWSELRLLAELGPDEWRPPFVRDSGSMAQQETAWRLGLQRAVLSPAQRRELVCEDERVLALLEPERGSAMNVHLVRQAFLADSGQASPTSVRLGTTWDSHDEAMALLDPALHFLSREGADPWMLASALWAPWSELVLRNRFPEVQESWARLDSPQRVAAMLLEELFTFLQPSQAEAVTSLLLRLVSDAPAQRLALLQEILGCDDENHDRRRRGPSCSIWLQHLAITELGPTLDPEQRRSLEGALVRNCAHPNRIPWFVAVLEPTAPRSDTG